MSLTRQIAHNTIIQITGKVISTLLGFVAIAMMTRYLGVEQFGWYITAISFLQFAGILIDFGLIPVTAQMLGEGKFERTTLFQNLLGFRCITAFVCLLVVPLVALFFPYPHEVKVAIALSTLSFFAISLNQIFTGFFQTELKMHLVSLGDLVSRLVLVGGLFMMIHFGASFQPIMILITVSTVAYTLVQVFFARKYISVGLGFDLKIWKAIIIKMWPITLSIVFNVVYLKGDIILVSLYRSQAEVALYGAAYRVIDIVTQIAMLSIGIMLPLLASSHARANKKNFAEHYERAIVIMSLLGFPLVVGTYLLSSPIMRLIGGENFVGSGRALQILSLAICGLFLGAIYGHIAVAINKQKQTMFLYIGVAFLTLIGYLLVIPQYGMIGAAWMSVFSESVVGIGLFFLIRSYIRLPLPSKFLIKVFISTAIMGGVIYFFQNLPLVLTIGIAVLVYGLCLILTKTISKDTIKEIVSFQ